MLNHGSGSSAGSAPDGGGLRSLLRNFLIVAVVGALAAWALSFRAEVSQALREALPEVPRAAQNEDLAGQELPPYEQEGEASDEAYGEQPSEAPYDDEAYDEEAGDEAALSREITIRKDVSGHFLLTARVEGVAIRFLVDTGASDVVLSPDDAQRLRLNSRNLNYSREYQTANGTVRAAPVTLRDLQIGQLEVYDLEASVNEAPMGISLLGMSFLERLDGYAVEGNTLILRW
ncbi:MAG: TIGR02281 family clan AA aspartic protease [Kiloniellales bacterium]